MARARLELKFEYKESANHVYKTVKYSLNGRPVTARKKEVRSLLEDEDAPKILKQNTFFWKPAPHASWRRKREEKVKQEIIEWLQKKGFTVQVDPYYECLVIGVKG
jgi:hypothetical protein